MPSWLGARCRSRVILGLRRAAIERHRIGGRSSRRGRIIGYLYAGGQDGRIEVDVATRTVCLGLYPLNDERAGIHRFAAFGPSLAWVRSRVSGIGDGQYHGPTLRRAANPFHDFLLQEVGTALGKVLLRDRYRFRR